MYNYFDLIIQNLTIEELKVLGYLNDQEADAIFKAIKRKDIMDSVDITMDKFRKSLIKLESNCFVKVLRHNKEHKYFITDFGVEALHKSIKGVS